MANEEVREKNVEIALQTAYEQFIYYGIESTTKLMIAKASGQSRPSIDRYFHTKTDCVIQTAKYVGESIRHYSNYPDTLFTDGEHSARELLKLYMQRARDLYAENPYVFVLYNEYKQYVFRHSESFFQGYNYLLDTLEYKKIIKRIFQLGIKDGSLPAGLDSDFETEFFSESFLGFLGNVALYSKDKMDTSLSIIDKYIDRTIQRYDAISG